MNNWYDSNNLKPNKNKRWLKILLIVFASIFLFSAIVAGAFFIRSNLLTDSKVENPAPNDSYEYFKNFFTETSTDSADVKIPKYDSKVSFSIVLEEKTDDPIELSELYKQCYESIVGIKAYKEENDEAYSWGTGVIISDDGLVITNTHIIDGCIKAEIILFNGKDSQYEARLIGADSISDIAVLKIDAHGLKPAVFGDSSELDVGEKCAAIGNPLGDKFSLTLTDGIISAIDRGINYKGHSMTLIQTNTALNEGNSGGALFNMYGQVIGITNMKMMSSFSSIEGIGFAIPSNTCKSVVDELITNGQVRGRPSMGITVGQIPSEAKTMFNLPDGLYIMSVVESSDAFTKGLQPGDVVTAINGKLCTTTAEANLAKDGLKVGDSITLTIYRDGETFDVKVILMDTVDIYG